jgi:hypothetical protein
VLVLATGCGSVSAHDFCVETAWLSCRKTFECARTDEEKRLLHALWADVPACVEAQLPALRCDQVTDATACASNRVWDGRAASQCLADAYAVPCESYRMGEGLPASCGGSLVCRSP